MSVLIKSSIVILSVALILQLCSSLNKTKKGAADATATGTRTGAVIGRVAGNTAPGAITVAAVGGAARLDVKGLTIKGYGKAVPEYYNDTDEGRAQKRRFEFLISANEKMIEEDREEVTKKFM